MDLDDTDRRLTALLRDDARRPASSLAAALGTPPDFVFGWEGAL